MTVSLFKLQKKWLWVLLGAWLLVMQSVALSHSAEHALESKHSHCLLCNFGDNSSAGLPAILMPPTVLQRAEYIVSPLATAPSLAWFRQLNVRAPPFLF